jgi:SAM-dependent methyltransferase
MHESVMRFLRDNLSGPEVKDKSVLEVGSQDVNGSPRAVIAPLGPSSYVGVDFAAGPGVDVVGDAGDLVALFSRDRFDVVVSTEMLEHARDWRGAVRSMKRVLKPGGLLIVTTRGPGFPYHGFPHDYWRFTPADFLEIFHDFLFSVCKPDPQYPGILLKARKPEDFHEVDISQIEVLPAPTA